MSLERSWKIRVDDILTWIEKIEAYTLGMTFEQFGDDGKTVDAVIRNTVLRILRSSAQPLGTFIHGATHRNSGEIS